MELVALAYELQKAVSMKAFLLSFFIFSLPNISNGKPLKPFLCGDVKTYSLEEFQVQSLIFNNRLSLGRSLPREFVQCGLPGINWKVCKSCEKENVPSLLTDVIPMLSSKEHRDWHYYWHSIRRELSSDVNNIPPNSERLVTLVNEGWITLEEAKAVYERKDFRKFISEHAVGGSRAGEDFLYMHRQMIKMLQVEQGASDSACISPWQDLPHSVLDSQWPVPRATYLQSKGKEIKYEEKQLDEILFLVTQLQDKDYLKRVSLNRLGTDIENRIHGKLHILYASPHSKCLNPMTDDSKQCKDLTHDRSSHVNKYFWKLHGFIDGLIGDWLKVNGYEFIYKDCSLSPLDNKCYEWKGTWLGKEPY